jgi:hypothetical protein
MANSNKQIVFQALAQDPTNPLKYFSFLLIYDAGTGAYQAYVLEQSNPNYFANASQVAAAGVPLAGSGGTGMVIGSPVVGGADDEVLFVDALGHLAQDSQFTFDNILKVFRVGDNTSAFLIVDPDSSLINLLTGATQETGIAIDETDVEIATPNGLASVGDLAGSGNSTYISIDDVSEQIDLNASNPVNWRDNVTQTFNPGATNAGVNVGSVAADPSSPDDGDIWYNSATEQLKARINGASVALGADSFAFPGVPSVTGLAYVQSIKQSSGAGDLVVYTCPAGKKAFVGLVAVFNTSGGALNAILRVKDGASSYRMGATTATGAGASNFLGTNNIFLLEAGQSLVVNVDGAGLNIFPNIAEFDNTAPITSIRNNALVNGNNTLYTCPAGKSAFLINSSISNNPLCVSGSIWVANESGGALNYISYCVPSGQAVGSAYQQVAATSVANNAINTVNFGSPPLSAGDFVVLNTSGGGAGQSASIIVVEIDL